MEDRDDITPQKLLPQVERLLPRERELLQQRGELQNSLLSRENPQRTSLKTHPQIVQCLGRFEGALRRIHTNPELRQSQRRKSLARTTS